MTTDLLIATPTGAEPWAATMRFRGGDFRAAIGRSGITADKREGDGASPLGAWPMRRLHYRADRLILPAIALPARAIRPEDGWCDDPAHRDYNRLVRRPFAASHEKMWREDGLYDLVVELGYNDDPPVPGRGSAIFLHVARPDFGPTAGCLALAKADLLDALTAIGPDAAVVFERLPPAT
jgi:L,D-peptidoglycan transpeptidase YkuD (ErfK/YbiS/YcfS/YnhG family)